MMYYIKMEQEIKKIREVLIKAEQKAYQQQQPEQEESVNSMQISEMGIILNSKDSSLREIIVLCKGILEDKTFKDYLFTLKENAKRKLAGQGYLS